MTTPGRADAGFSLVEVLIALTILLAAMAPLLQISASGQHLARSHGEATDLHQRIRVAADRLKKDLALAGAGAIRGPVSDLTGGLTSYMAPLVPARTGGAPSRSSALRLHRSIHRRVCGGRSLACAAQRSHGDHVGGRAREHDDARVSGGWPLRIH